MRKLSLEQSAGSDTILPLNDKRQSSVIQLDKQINMNLALKKYEY